jgi:putative FmdB family regulatory protein
MPLYEYYCADCKGRFEVLTTYEAAQAGATVCTTCHGKNVRKLLSVVAKRSHGGGDDDFGDAGDFSDASDFGDAGDYGDDTEMSGGSCGCGGACSCNN